MIHRLLTEERIKTPPDDGIVKGNASLPAPEVRVEPYAKSELAKNLSITLGELEKLKLLDFYSKMVNKISLPLVTLYCATKFVDGEYKGGS